MSNLGKFAEGFSSLRRLLADVTENSTRLHIFYQGASEVAGYIKKGLDRAVAADELNEIANAYGIIDAQGVDAVQDMIAEAFSRDTEQEEKPKANGHHKVDLLPILSKSEFIKNFIPPDYLIEGILQRRFIYSMTGQTGHAKTAIALLIASLVSSPEPNSALGTHLAEKGHVIYFVGENPDDVRMRVIGADSLRSPDIDTNRDNISFIAGIFNIGKMYDTLNAEIAKRGPLDLVIVDTSAAYFLGNEELSNTQMGGHARMLRKLTDLPGGPCVLVLCHPIKHVIEPAQLLPRGGGAYLAEVDGNLTVWRCEDTLIELHHNKIRGPGFEPIMFKLETIITSKLCDKKGRKVPTVRAVVANEAEQSKQSEIHRSDEDHVIAAMLKTPNMSFAEIADTCGWKSSKGEPQKSKVQRILGKLEKLKPKLASNGRDGWHLTEDGKTAARVAAKHIDARERMQEQWFDQEGNEI